MINFGRITTNPCINTVITDDRCQDEAFALQNPDICPPASRLILKPGVALACLFRSIQFRACFYQDGVETDVTTQTVFTSGNLGVAMVSGLSGSATGISVGTTLITARYGIYTATAELTVLPDAIGDCDCCDDLSVAAMVLVDHTRSMSQTFGGAYATKLHFARAAAQQFIGEINETKDSVGLLEFTDASNETLSAPTTDKALVAALVPAIAQTQQLTSFYDALSTAIDELNNTTADRKVLYLITDGEDSDTSYSDGDNPIALLDNFKSSGGIVIVLGARAHDRGYNLLLRLATGGFFVNAYSANVTDAIAIISGLKGFLCAGNCNPVGDEYVGTGSLNYIDYLNWDVTGGYTDLQGNDFFDYLPGHGLYVDLVSGSQPSGDANPVLTLKDPLPIEPGKTYELRLKLAGNQIVPNNTGAARVRVFSDAGTCLDQTIVITDYRQGFKEYSFAFTCANHDNVYIDIQQVQGQGLPTPSGGQRAGLLLDDVVFECVTDLLVLFEDDFNSENLTYVPPRCDPALTYYSFPGLSAIADPDAPETDVDNGESVDPLFWFKGDGVLFSDDGITPIADSDPVYRWDDATANNYDIKQAVASWRPTFVDNELNGLPVVRFTPSTGPFTPKFISKALISIPQPLTIVAVVKFSVSTGTTFVSDGSVGRTIANYAYNSPGMGRRPDNGNAALFEYDAATGPPDCLVEGGPLSLSQWYLMVGVLDGVNSVLRVDGVEVATGNIPAQSIEELQLGGDTGGGAFSPTPFNGDIAEVIGFGEVLSTEEIETWEATMIAKYNL